MSAPLSHRAFRLSLQPIAQSPGSGLRAEVANIILEYGGDDIPRWLDDLFQHGCVSGMVSPLIYYSDTHQFFDRHYQEIEELRQEVEEDLGQPLTIDGDLKNTLAWFAFEETARRIADEINEGGDL